MDRLDWMYLRALVPSGLALAFTFVLATVLKQTGVSPVLVALASFAPWVFQGGIGVALFLAIESMYRIWQWHQGEGLTCPNCSGPLGDRIDGRYGPCYKCLCCSGNIAARRVE
jgi:hypothetical protein